MKARWRIIERIAVSRSPIGFSPDLITYGVVTVVGCLTRIISKVRLLLFQTGYIWVTIKSRLSLDFIMKEGKCIIIKLRT